MNELHTAWVGGFKGTVLQEAVRRRGAFWKPLSYTWNKDQTCPLPKDGSGQKGHPGGQVNGVGHQWEAETDTRNMHGPAKMLTHTKALPSANLCTQALCSGSEALCLIKVEKIIKTRRDRSLNSCYCLKNILLYVHFNYCLRCSLQRSLPLLVILVFLIVRSCLK